MRGTASFARALLRIATLAIAVGSPAALADADDELVIVDEDAAVSADGVVHFGAGAGRVTPPGPPVAAGGHGALRL
jgi:hypothetical protein